MKSCVHFVVAAAFINFVAGYVSDDSMIEDIQVSSHLNLTFICNANTMNVCGPQKKPATSPQCRSEGYKITAYGFSQLATQLELKAKRVTEEVENTPHFLPKYTIHNYGRSNINETFYERVPSPLTPGQKDSVTVVCNGTWNTGTPNIGLQRMSDCDSGKLSCSQIHALVNNVALLELARYLRESSKDNYKMAEEVLKKNKSRMSSRNDEEEEEEVGGFQSVNVIMKTLSETPKLKLQGPDEALSTTTTVMAVSK